MLTPVCLNICTICKDHKSIDAFPKKKKMKKGIANQCSSCLYLKKADYLIKNKEAIQLQRQNYYKQNFQKIQQNHKEYRKKNFNKIKQSLNLWREKNPEKCAIISKKYTSSHSDKIKEQKQRWAKNNKDSVRAYVNKWRRDSYRTDLNYKMNAILRVRLRKYLNTKDAKKAVLFLGCSIPELRNHLESQFKEGMSWDNHSFEGWHVDHIKPLSSFNLTDDEQVKQACHYTNLQPLWAKDNLSKGDKYTLSDSGIRA